MVKILRKSQGSISKIECFHRYFVVSLVNNRYFVVIAFKVLKMEFKFKCTVLITKV